MDGPEWTVAMAVFAVLVVAPLVAVAAVGIAEVAGPTGLFAATGVVVGLLAVWLIRRTTTPRE